MNKTYNISFQVDMGSDYISQLRHLIKKLSPQKTNYPLIRVGGAGDGGYLLPDDLGGITACFSPGVGETSSFEHDMVGRGVPCFLADASVEKEPAPHPLIHFEKKFLGLDNDNKYTTLENWVARHAKTTDNQLLLQMDIEGGEYDVLLQTPSDILKRFRIMVMEFHGLSFLFTFLGVKLFIGLMEKLLKDFIVVHAHPNNCQPPLTIEDLSVVPVMEFTFLRRDRVAGQTLSPVLAFPHPLDKDNVPDKPSVILPPCWYGG